MAEIKQLIPFILYFEAGMSKHHIDKSLDEMLAHARKTGWANDPDDRGGATQCGITIGTYRTYCARKRLIAPTENDLKNITPERWQDVLKSLFWDRWQADTIDCQPIANILVDWVWASGHNGVKIPQKILGVKADGIVGPETIAALNAANPHKLFKQIKQARINFVEGIVQRNPTQKKFLRGWKRRIEAITFDGLQYT